jgi:hypothetical protein
MDIKKIKFNNPGLRIRELTAGGIISNTEWKKISKKAFRLN